MLIADATQLDSVVEVRELSSESNGEAAGSSEEGQTGTGPPAPTVDLELARNIVAAAEDEVVEILSQSDLQVAFVALTRVNPTDGVNSPGGLDDRNAAESSGHSDAGISESHGLMPPEVRAPLMRMLLDQIAVMASLESTELISRSLRDARLEAMAEFAAGAGHEINNPLGSIRGRAELLLREEEDPERRRSLATIGAQVDRVRDMIGDAMLYARPPIPSPAATSVNDVLREEIERAESRYESPGVLVELDGQCAPAWLADADQLRVVLRALLRNCFEACGDEGSIRVEIKAIDASGWLQIRDNGQRLTEEQQRHAFDPFYSGRSAGRGLGFGLSNSWRIVKAHGGEILLDTHQDRGCTTTILWPLA